MKERHVKYVRVTRLALMSLLLTSLFTFRIATAKAQISTCNRTVTADVVAFDQVITYKGWRGGR